MRNFINIVEAPLADVEVHGNPLDQDGSYSHSDRAYMHRAIIKGIYKKSLEGLPFNLYFYILNASPLAEYGKQYPETMITPKFIRHLKNIFPQLDEPLDRIVEAIEINRSKDKSAIHFVMGDNFSAENQIVPTPWIVIHRLLHTWLQDTMLEVTKVSFQLEDYTRKPLTNFLGFKSARMGRVLDATELVGEIATDYLMTGDIRLRNLEELSGDGQRLLADWVKRAEHELMGHVRSYAGKAFYV